MQVGQTRGQPKGAGAPHPAPKRKTGFFGRLSRMSGNLNPFEEEEVNPRHRHNLQMTVGKVGELVIDGKTLEHVLGTPLEPLLALLGSQCGSVVICRASPSQKAAIVRMMAEFEVRFSPALSQSFCRCKAVVWHELSASGAWMFVPECVKDSADMRVLG